MNESKNMKSRAHSWLVAVAGGALATVLSTYILYILPPEKLRTLVSNRQPVVHLQNKDRREGWAYLGTFENGEWSQRMAAVGPRPPTIGERIKTTNQLNLRIAKPVWPFYHLGEVASQLAKGEMIEVVEVDQDVGRHRVWAFVRSEAP